MDTGIHTSYFIPVCFAFIAFLWLKVTQFWKQELKGYRGGEKPLISFY
jgi:hypothetical protein